MAKVSDRPQDAASWMRWVERYLRNLDQRIRSAGGTTGGGGGGTVTSVNGDSGPAVTLDAADVGADPAGTAASAVTAHEAASDPHPGYLTPAEGAAAYDALGAAAAAVSAHEAASDPHPGYLTPAEGNAAYQPLDSDLTAFAAKTAPAGAVVGTTDTQTLTNKTLTAPAISSPTGLVKGDVGLSAVDNTADSAKPVSTAQAAADAAVAAASVPTSRQVNAGTGLTGGGALSADRTLAADFGTGAGKVTQGNDARLSDARTPTAHAASHALGGSDALTFPARVLAISAPTISPGIVNTTTESDLVSLTVPAASVAAGDLLALTFGFDLLNNSGASVTYQFRVKLGATTIAAGPSTSIAANAQRLEGYGQFSLLLATLSDERLWGGINAGGQNTRQLDTFTQGNSLAGAGNATEDLTSDKTLKVTVQMSAASASADIRSYGAALTRVR